MLEIMKEYGWTQEELAEHLGLSPGQVSKVLQVSKRLAPDLQEKIIAGDLHPRSAYLLLACRTMRRSVRCVR